MLWAAEVGAGLADTVDYHWIKDSLKNFHQKRQQKLLTIRRRPLTGSSKYYTFARSFQHHVL
jgi:hypothetical protein